MPPKQQTDPDALMVCPTCFQQNHPRNAMCTRCYSPLNSFAASDPVLSVHSEFNTFHKAMRGSAKPVVLIGMWLIWGPIFLGVGAFSVIAARGVFAPSAYGRDSEIGSRLLILLILCVTGGMTFIAGKVLWSTTRNFFRLRAAQEADEAIEAAKDKEYQERLAKQDEEEDEYQEEGDADNASSSD